LPSSICAARSALDVLGSRERDRLRRRLRARQSTDFIIASDNAIFGQPEAMLGLAAGGRSGQRAGGVPARHGQRPLYPQDELINAAYRLAEKIASNSPTAVQAVKQAVRMGRGADRASDRHHDGGALAL
jgi:enoyl-CoA hydratase/carnithine racemase